MDTHARSLSSLFPWSRKSFGHYAALYEKQIANKSPKTRELVRGILNRHLLPEFGKVPATAINPAQVKLYIAEKSKTHQCYNHLKYLKAVLLLARESGVPVREFRIQNPDRPKRDMHKFTPAEMVRLFSACRNVWGPHKRRLWTVRLCIYIAYTMGLRKSIILGLQWKWIDLEKGWLTIPADAPGMKKTRSMKPHIMPINKVVLRILRARRRRNPIGDFVFPGKKGGAQTDIDRSFDRLCDRCKIDGSFHGLRGTCAVMICKAGVSLEITCLLLRMTPDVLRRHYLEVDLPLARFAVDYAAKINRQAPELVLRLTRDPVTRLLSKVA